MIARVAVWEPMPTDDRDWLVDAMADVPGVHAVYHLLDPETGNGLSVAVFEDEAAAEHAGAAIRHRAEEVGWHDGQRPARVSETFYQVLRGRP
ncbi:hypothetical protein [Micromonospora sp. IBHARD004]|uniref:hypothetical protein n=1 Tax=Micromonospora sp. IBHARD004 TaxID=3457764 RepID=UPI0040593541